jgi:hypothetical protein
MKISVVVLAQAAFDPNLTQPQAKWLYRPREEARTRTADFRSGSIAIEMPCLRNVRFHPKSDRRSDSADIVKRQRPSNRHVTLRRMLPADRKVTRRIDEIRAGPHRKGTRPFLLRGHPLIDSPSHLGGRDLLASPLVSALEAKRNGER